VYLTRHNALDEVHFRCTKRLKRKERKERREQREEEQRKEKERRGEEREREREEQVPASSVLSGTSKQISLSLSLFSLSSLSSLSLFSLSLSLSLLKRENLRFQSLSPVIFFFSAFSLLFLFSFFVCLFFPVCFVDFNLSVGVCCLSFHDCDFLPMRKETLLCPVREGEREKEKILFQKKKTAQKGVKFCICPIVFVFIFLEKRR